ncbi:MAG: hypothetical protein R2793_09015 [Flavobacteriaceae bacterium]
MRTFIIIFSIAIAASCTSCATAHSVKKTSPEVAGYTLKNKKELMQQKVLNTQTKTSIAQP